MKITHFRISGIRPLVLTCSFAVLMSCADTKKNTESSENEAEKVEATVEEETITNEGQRPVLDMMKKTGDYNQLLAKKDVVYEYTYRTPDGKEDISTEKYTFANEKSLGEYMKHERTLADMEGKLVQGFDGENFWVSLDGKRTTDSTAVEGAQFTRKTNFFWFAMMQKMGDPGLIYEPKGEKIVDGQSYTIVRVSYESPDDTPKDIYELYVNQNTQLVDQFLFTVVDKGVTDQPLLMKVTYESFDGVMIPTYRKYTRSTWDGTVADDAKWTEEICKNIKFNQGVAASEFAAPQ